MSLFGAMTSGVSGLVAQSSAMGAIADNITNVNTVGYKKTKTDFQSLVTKQTSVTFYSAGGVQARPLQQNDVQGLLQATTSQTDISVSGAGMFVVNESNRPGIDSQYVFTRAGSFYQDEEGFLRNAAGFYLQAWPTDAQGNVTLPPGSTAAQTNENIISNDFLQTVNLSRVGGTASETSTIAMGANLPSTSAAGDMHKMDIQFFDTLGTTNDVSMRFAKSSANVWDMTVEPPTGTSVLNLYDDAGAVYQSMGQLEFTSQPPDNATVAIAGETFQFFPDAAAAAAYTGGGGTDTTVVKSTTLVGTVANLMTAVRGTDSFNGTTGNYQASQKEGNETVLLLSGGSGGGPNPASITVDVTGTKDFILQGTAANTTYTVDKKTTTAPGAVEFSTDGLPKSFGVGSMAVLDFVNGSANLDYQPVGSNVDATRVTLDFGNVGEANGMTQYGPEFTPAFIQQDGARFGVFAGVTINSDGLMTALFDNGEIRPIFKIPLATFVNPNGLEGRTGNAWNATQASGDPTLRAADKGPAGQVAQAALEASTVDIGEEFTDMIMVQRAYSAATKIISTADEMLEELVRVKR